MKTHPMTEIKYIANAIWMSVEFIKKVQLLNGSSYDPWSSPGNQYARGNITTMHIHVAQKACVK